MAPRSSAKRSYRKRVRSSPCRGKGRTTCRATKRCKYTSGKKRSFCRKVKNTKRHTMRRRSRKGAAMRRRTVGGLWVPGNNWSPIPGGKRAHRGHRGGAMLPLAPHAFPEPNDNLRGPPFPPLGGPTHHA
jgi:hypothetical protein